MVLEALFSLGRGGHTFCMAGIKSAPNNLAGTNVCPKRCGKEYPSNNGESWGFQSGAKGPDTFNGQQVPAVWEGSCFLAYWGMGPPGKCKYLLFS